MYKNVKCSICNEKIVSQLKDVPTLWGNNPQPVTVNSERLKVTERCCDKCNNDIVIPLRLAESNKEGPHNT